MDIHLTLTKLYHTHQSLKKGNEDTLKQFFLVYFHSVTNCINEAIIICVRTSNSKENPRSVSSSAFVFNLNLGVN
jgi:hypothetical protein